MAMSSATHTKKEGRNFREENSFINLKKKNNRFYQRCERKKKSIWKKMGFTCYIVSFGDSTLDEYRSSHWRRCFTMSKTYTHQGERQQFQKSIFVFGGKRVKWLQCVRYSAVMAVWKMLGDVDARWSAGGLKSSLWCDSVSVLPAECCCCCCCLEELLHGSLTGSSQRRRLVFIVAATKLLPAKYAASTATLRPFAAVVLLANAIHPYTAVSRLSVCEWLSPANMKQAVAQTWLCAH